MTSHHPQDEKFGYCGNCHEFTGDLAALRCVDYMDFLNWTFTQESREQFSKLAETVKRISAEFFARGGRIAWPRKAPDPPPTATLTPYIDGTFVLPRATLEEASKLRFHTGKKRLRTAIDCMADGLLVQEFEDDSED